MSVSAEAGGLRRWFDASFRGSDVEGSPWINRLVVAAIFGGSLLAILETEPEIWRSPAAALVFRILDPLLLVVFSLEYLLRLWSAGEDPRYAGFTGRLKWMSRPWQAFDLALIVIFLLPLVGPEVFVLRLLRLGRILAVLRLGRLTLAGQTLAACIAERRYELGISIIMSLLLLVFSAICLYVVEGSGQPEAFGSIPRAMWWSMATLTTVGYGDVYPLTPLGRVLAGLVAFIGIGVIAIPTGILAAAFSTALNRQRPETAEETRP